MRIRRALALLSFALLAATPLSAQFLRGEVELVTSAGYWVAFPDFPRVVGCCADTGQYKFVPYFADQFVIPAPNIVVFHDGHTMSFWDGSAVPLNDSRPAYSTIFSDAATLIEIAPLRSGRFLVASATKLIEFDTHQKISERPFEGAQHIEVLADACTLLYTKGDTRVRRMNLCTNEVESDFASLLMGEAAGVVRQLPNGHVVVAVGSGVVEFQADGSFWTYYPLHATHVALTPDGDAFWAATTDAKLFLVSPRATSSVDTEYTGKLPIDIQALVVVGEWRASNPPARARGVRRR